MFKDFIHRKIFEIGGQKVMFDFDLSTLYSVETRTLKQAVRRNIKRFPKDFLIELSMEEWRELITVCDILPETAKYSHVPPFAFTEYCHAFDTLKTRAESLNRNPSVTPGVTSFCSIINS